MKHNNSISTIDFVYTSQSDINVIPSSPNTHIKYTIDADVTLQEACQAFENFLLSCGFRLNDGETIGIIENL